MVSHAAAPSPSTPHNPHTPHTPHTHRDPRLDAIRDKVVNGERLSLADGDLLFTTPDIYTVIELANLVRNQLHGDAAYYNINRHLNYSNVCALSCKFCEFYAKAGDDKAYTRDMAYVRDQVRQAVDGGATEMHSVGGLHPSLPFSYYTDLVSTIRDEARRLGSELHVKAFTAVEIVHFARIAKQYKGASAPGEEGREARRAGLRWVLTQLKDAGLGSLPGGGAEVFDDRVHDEAYKGKIRSDVWLDVHRVAHEIGLNTNATLLYGHIEERHDRLVHMDMLRRAQDEALARLGYQGVEQRARSVSDGSSASQFANAQAGHLGYRPDESNAPAITLTREGTPLPERVVFANAESRMPNAGSSDSANAESRMPNAGSSDSANAESRMPNAAPSGYYQTIIPLPFFPDGSALEHLPGPTGLENYRTLAIARLMLDNFPHVKAFWIMQTLPVAQIMLQSGADDIDGTVVWYDITKVGGATTHQEASPWTFQRLIHEAGYRAIERDTLYRRVVRDGKRWRSV